MDSKNDKKDKVFWGDANKMVTRLCFGALY